VATVSTANRDHSSTAKKPIKVAMFRVIGSPKAERPGTCPGLSLS
jgi:hypothetical protein